MLLLRGWGQFALLQKWTQFVPYRRGKSNAVFVVMSCHHYPPPHSMDGFKVVKLEDVCHFVDIVITCTGKADT